MQYGYQRLKRSSRSRKIFSSLLRRNENGIIFRSAPLSSLYTAHRQSINHWHKRGLLWTKFRIPALHGDIFLMMSELPLLSYHWNPEV